MDTGAAVSVDKAEAGLNINFDRGRLVVGHGMNVLGTIHESATVLSMSCGTPPTQEIFRRATGVLDLYRSYGPGSGQSPNNHIASLKFSGASARYTSPCANGGLAIATTPHAGDLPVTFTS